MSHKEQISRLEKSKSFSHRWGVEYNTRKDWRNKKFNPFIMRSCKGRTKIRRYENRRWRRNKLSVDNWKKFGINYRHSIW